MAIHLLIRQTTQTCACAAPGEGLQLQPRLMLSPAEVNLRKENVSTVSGCWAGLGWAGAGLVCSAAVTHQISTTHTVQAGYSALSRPRLTKIFTILYLQ